MNTEKIRKDFPMLQRKIRSKSLIYFDSAATTHKPIQVIEAVKNFYENHNANIHRSIYTLGEEATEMYEKSREKVARLINAKPSEIIFTRSCTEALNFAIFGYGNTLERNGKIMTSEMEHHSNIVPWQQLAKMRGLRLQYIPVTQEGKLSMNNDMFKEIRFLGITHASNVLGTINDIKDIVKKAHDNNTLVVVDAAQTVPHFPVDVKNIDADFMAFSGHKMLGPSGIGILYGKQEVLEKIDPHTLGSEMIKEVSLHGTLFNDLPWKFEYGTGNIEGAIGLGTAIDYLKKIGLDRIQEYDKNLTDYALRKFKEIDFLTIYGQENAGERAPLISFTINGIHAHDIATILDQEGIAIRSGHHCAMPLHRALGIEASARASFYLYNTKQEIDKLCEALEKAKEKFMVKQKIKQEKKQRER